MLAAKKRAVIVSFRKDTKILTADRTAGSAAVCKEAITDKFVMAPMNMRNCLAVTIFLSKRSDSSTLSFKDVYYKYLYLQFSTVKFSATCRFLKIREPAFVISIEIYS